MNILQKISIRNKVLVLILIIVVPILIGQAVVTIYRNNIIAKAEMLENYTHLTKATAEYSSVDLVFGDREEATKSAGQLLVVKNVLEVVIYDDIQEEFAHKTILNTPLNLSPIARNSHTFSNNRLLIHQDVRTETDVVGSVFVVVSTEKLWSKLQNEAMYTILVCLVMLVIVILASFVLQRYISIPILALTKFTKKVAKEQNYSLRKRLNSGDEIADLVVGVNQMLTEIEETTVSKDFMLAVVENMTNAFTVINAEGTIKEVNVSLVKMLGQNANELIGRSILDFIDAEGFMFDTHEKFIETNIVNVPQGTTPVEYSTFSVDSENVVCVIHDLTRRKNYEHRIKASLKEKETLIKEIHHRVKNNLQIMSSLMNLQANAVSSPEVDEVFSKSKSRIYSMALIHAKLYQTEDLISIDVKDYVETLAQEIIRSYNVNKSIQLTINSEVKSFGIDVLVPMGLMFNELIINTIKYAFPDVDKGEIIIDFKDAGNGVYSMMYADNGIGLPKEFDLAATHTLGMKLIKIFTEQLDGEVDIDANHKGFKIDLKFKKELAYPEG